MYARHILGIGCLAGIAVLTSCTSRSSPTADQSSESRDPGPDVVATEKAQVRPKNDPEPVRLGEEKAPVPSKGENKTAGDQPGVAGSKLRTADWAERLTIEGEDGHKSRIECVAFSPDGGTFASASIDASVKLWDVATGKLKLTITLDHEDRPGPVAFAPDGKTLAFGGFRDPWVTLADPTSGKTLRKLKDAKDKIRGIAPAGLRCLAYTRDGKMLATGGDDDTVRLLDPETGTLRHAMPADMYSVQTLAFSPDEGILAAAGGGRSGAIRLWNVATRKELAAAKNLKDAIWSVTFSPDGKLLASASSGNDIKLWDVDGRTEIKEAAAFRGDERSRYNAANCVLFTRDGRTLVAGSGNEVDGGMLQFIDVGTRKVRDSVVCTHAIRCLAISADGKSMAVGTWSGVDRKTVKNTPPKLMFWSAIR